MKILTSYHRRTVLPRLQRGFSLIELLVVVAILATIAFVATTSLFGVTERTEGQIATAELAAAAKAVRQFRADTGYFPTEGVFAKQSACPAVYGANPLAKITAGSNCQWFYHAANLSQLTGADGMQQAMQTVMPWNAVTERGWRGPYLSSGANAFANVGEIYWDVGAGIVNNATSGSVIADVPVVMAGVSLRPKGNYFVTKRQKTGNALEIAPRPILMFVRKDSTTGRADRVALVSTGADGIFNGFSGECTPQEDDMAICIYANQ